MCDYSVDASDALNVIASESLSIESDSRRIEVEEMTDLGNTLFADPSETQEKEYGIHSNVMVPIMTETAFNESLMTDPQSEDTMNTDFNLGFLEMGQSPISIFSSTSLNVTRISNEQVSPLNDFTNNCSQEKATADQSFYSLKESSVERITVEDESNTNTSINDQNQRHTMML